MSNKKHRVFDWKIAAVIATVALGVVATRPSISHYFERLPEDLKPYKAKYGPGRHSEHGEEWLIRDFFQDKRGGFFVDVGANHYLGYNNTYFLEVGLGWSGIAVEPQKQFAADYAAHRPRTRFRSFFVSDTSDQAAKLFVLKRNPLVTSADKSFVDRYGGGAEAVSAPTITLDDLLAAEGISRIDFLTMDIETWEPKALAGFDIRRFAPALVCVEAHPEVTQQILNYFSRNGYVVVAKYLRADEHNLYFAPARDLDLSARSTP